MNAARRGLKPLTLRPSDDDDSQPFTQDLRTGSHAMGQPFNNMNVQRGVQQSGYPVNTHAAKPSPFLASSSGNASLRPNNVSVPSRDAPPAAKRICPAAPVSMQAALQRSVLEPKGPKLPPNTGVRALQPSNTSIAKQPQHYNNKFAETIRNAITKPPHAAPAPARVETSRMQYSNPTRAERVSSTPHASSGAKQTVSAKITPAAANTGAKSIPTEDVCEPLGLMKYYVHPKSFSGQVSKLKFVKRLETRSVILTMSVENLLTRWTSAVKGPRPPPQHTLFEVYGMITTEYQGGRPGCREFEMQDLGVQGSRRAASIRCCFWETDRRLGVLSLSVPYRVIAIALEETMSGPRLQCVHVRPQHASEKKIVNASLSVSDMFMRCAVGC